MLVLSPRNQNQLIYERRPALCYLSHENVMLLGYMQLILIPFGLLVVQKFFCQAITIYQPIRHSDETGMLTVTKYCKSIPLWSSGPANCRDNFFYGSQLYFAYKELIDRKLIFWKNPNSVFSHLLWRRPVSLGTKLRSYCR